MKLTGKVAIVTGASRGIGTGIALCLAQEGANVAICSRTLPDLEKIATQISALGHKPLVVKANVTDPAQVKELVDKTIATFGRIDILVNNVGAADKTTEGIAKIDDEAWDRAYQINFKSAVYMCRAVAPVMKSQQSGKIINISSVSGKIGNSFEMSYSAMKGALINLTWALARELSRYNINVNCICPGLIYTPFWEKGAEELWKSVPAYRSLKEPKEIFYRYVKKLVPLGREQQPEDIGYMVVFLSSEEAKNITGQSINVDGGMVMQ